MTILDIGACTLVSRDVTPLLQVYKDGCALGGTEPGQEAAAWCYTVPEESNQRWGFCQHAMGK